MGHGLASIIVGGNFEKLIIYSNGSGLAISSYSESYFISKNISLAIVSASGLLGATIFGAIFMLCSKNKLKSKSLLILFNCLLIFSIIVWVRSLIGIITLGLISLCILYVIRQKNKDVHQLFIQFIALQAFISSYSQIDYLFSESGTIDGQKYLSDSAKIGNYLGYGSYWFWAVVIILISFFIIYKSIKYSLN